MGNKKKVRTVVASVKYFGATKAILLFHDLKADLMTRNPMSILIDDVSGINPFTVSSQ